MPESPELREFSCPSCGSKAMLDARFVQWCVKCGHGADPNPPKLGKRARRRAERESVRSLRLFESLRTVQDLRPTSASGLAVTAISSMVHLISIVVLVLPIWLVAATDGLLLWDVTLVIGVMTFLAVLPRWAFRFPVRAGGIGRDQAPNLYALLDRCAAELGCAVPTEVFFDGSYNAATGRVALRRYQYLVLGMPLWTVLSGQERIALLGHELGHQVNGDPTHGIWAGTARWSLVEWMRVLNPRQSRYERSRAAFGRRTRGVGLLAAILAPVLQAIVFLPLYLIAFCCSILLTRLDLYCGQRAEYLADELGARLAGSDALDGLLGKLALADPVNTFIRSAQNQAGIVGAGRKATADPSGLWPRLARFAESVPETERERRRIVDTEHNTRADRTHPANHLRAALTHDRLPLSGTIKLSEDEWARIDAELAPRARAVARTLTVA